MTLLIHKTQKNVIFTIIALFFNQQYTSKYLTDIPPFIPFVYLQEIINNLISKLKYGYSLDSNHVNELHNYCVFCGMKDNMCDFILTNLGMTNKIISVNVDKPVTVSKLLTNLSPHEKIVAIKINRRNSNIEIDITKRICCDKKTWLIQSLLCKEGDNEYCLVLMGNEWVMFSNKIPSMCKVDITNSEFAHKIKLETQMIFYVNM